ncbi:MAG: hypothetical protein A2070_01665 [Bdellovibrionales bacterium GWC1_52_8]|nr:MAG: hypothetical protein A2Z97_11735 [Bdellovibrionales bacterium GWB1_52_6]OFZ05367.1 MAG: hypothetical protein A2X97_16615 [Bdellovibrionales bacterium GWA1_52_35]OFZ43093.1 MAG: hypothetical protein A2070_01665 [Bdellovibrionales bacterium GWC1_52_8]HCM38990.1 hypothetical protein [Bdellovibrionales bacterium]
MISYAIYKLIHVVGVMLVFLAAGGLVVAAMSVQASSGETIRKHAWWKKLAITHGAGLFLVLLGGFGLLARLEIQGDFPGWVWSKIGIWILIGAGLIPVVRKPNWSGALWWTTPLLGAAAALLAINKP